MVLIFSLPPIDQGLREESNLCARGRNPLLFQLSYGGKEVRMEGVEPSWPVAAGF
jgi:hypothetical protein